MQFSTEINETGGCQFCQERSLYIYSFFHMWLGVNYKHSYISFVDHVLFWMNFWHSSCFYIQINYTQLL